MTSRPALAFAILCLILAGQDCPCQPPAGRTDRYGDPLPPGVVARLGSERLTLANAVFLTFSPDGCCLAAHDGSNSLRVWSTATGKELLRLRTPRFNGWRAGMRPLVFSPDSKAVALACPGERWRRPRQQGAVHVWEVATGQERHCFGELEGEVECLVFSPDGRYLFGGGQMTPLLRWDLSGGKPAKEYGRFRWVTFLAVSGDGKTLTAATIDPAIIGTDTIIRWEAATGKETGRHTHTFSAIGSGVLSPDGSFLTAMEAGGKSIALLDPLTGREVSRAHGADAPWVISFSADGTTMTCTSKDGVIRVWDTASGKVRARFQALPTSLRWTALSADGKLLALSGRADDAVHVFDVAAGRELHSFIGHHSAPLTAAFLHGGKEVVTVSRDSQVSQCVTEWASWSFRRWDAATGAELAVTRADPKGEVFHTTFSADGRRLAVVAHDGTLRLWDVETGKELRTWKVPTREWSYTRDDGKGHQKAMKTARSTISELVFSADGKMLLAGEGSEIHRWETATGQPLPPLTIEGTWRSTSCLPSPDGRTLAVWCWSPTTQAVLLLDAASGKIKRRLDGIRQEIHKAAFSPDGRTLALDESAYVSLWEVAGGHSRGRLRGMQARLTFAFSPDGRYLAFGSNTQPPVILWDLGSGRIVGRLQEECGQVQQLVFSPDGSRLAVAGYSPTVLVVDVAALCGTKHGGQAARGIEPTASALEGLWAELTCSDRARVYRAIRRLGSTGSRGAAFLKSRLEGKEAPSEARIARLIAELDDNTFATRQKASAELGKLGLLAEPALRRALESETSAEARRRIERLLERIAAPAGPPPSPAVVRLRVVEALEANASNEARQALRQLAKSATDSVLSQQAKASLERLSRRPSAP